MKKICSWYKTLPEPQRSEALNNLSYLLSQRKSPNLVDALRDGFHWKTSKEGHEYWDIFTKEIESDEFMERHREDLQWETDSLPDFED
jgi:hypothetical protein